MHRICTQRNSFDLFTIYLRLYLPLPLCRLIMRFSPKPYLVYFWVGICLCWALWQPKSRWPRACSTQITRIEASRQCSQHKMAFICSLIVGIFETIPWLTVDLLSWWVWPLLAVLNHRDQCLCSGFCVCCVPGHKHLNRSEEVGISALFEPRFIIESVSVKPLLTFEKLWHPYEKIILKYCWKTERVQ